jgi:hypothetical protein
MPTARPGAPVDSRNAISGPPVIEIRSVAPDDDATAFRTLNEEWVTRYFTLEAKDRETLNNTAHSILPKGGHIFMAYAGSEAVGCSSVSIFREFRLDADRVEKTSKAPRRVFSAPSHAGLPWARARWCRPPHPRAIAEREEPLRPGC